MKKNMFGFSHFLDVVGLDIPRESFCHTEGTIEDIRSKSLNLRILKSSQNEKDLNDITAAPFWCLFLSCQQQ